MTTTRELRALIEREVRLPTDRDDVMALVGDHTVAAPGGEEESIGTVLARTDDARFETHGELFDTILGNLGEAYVGRKHYDDRGINHQERDTKSI